ncbi:MAG: Eco57I restriction-modification methylase domain-containing protein [Duncaniella sp.]|nr:Eco57I restriction-modification methylase domain-containing protein [Duncaniella sp.]
MFSPETLEDHQAIWDAAVAENIFVICKTPMAKKITRRTLLGFRSGKTNMWAPEDLINKIKNQPELFIKKVGDLVGKNVKINAIVGNPPYQVMDGGAGASAMPVYNQFVEMANNIKPLYISLITPSRWMTGGRGLEAFRIKMIKDTRLRVIHDYFDSNDIFSNVDIKGGISYFLLDLNYNGVCNLFTHLNDEVIVSHRHLGKSGNDVFIRHPKMAKIKESLCFSESFDKMVSSMKPYGLRGDFFANPSKYNLPKVSNTHIQSGIKIHGLDTKQNRVIRYVEKAYPLPASNGLWKYKIFVPRNYGIGLIGEAPSNPILASPGEACTETFIQIGPFNTHCERDNCDKYMKTKFFRCIVSMRKSDQGAGKNVYNFVPMQDFTEDSDIDWGKSVAEIDAQLYAKYNLSDEEITFIESMIKPM